MAGSRQSVERNREAYLRSIEAIKDPAERALCADAELKEVQPELRRIRNPAVVELARALGPNRVGGPRRELNWTAAAEKLTWSREMTNKRGKLGLAVLEDERQRPASTPGAASDHPG